MENGRKPSDLSEAERIERLELAVDGLLEGMRFDRRHMFGSIMVLARLMEQVWRELGKPTPKVKSEYEKVGDVAGVAGPNAMALLSDGLLCDAVDDNSDVKESLRDWDEAHGLS